MIGLASLFVVIISSLLITRVATVMLTLTGLSRESSQFQARSAFSGVGFTTAESESVVNHPVRRRIIMTLVLIGNAGVVTVLVSLLLSFGSVDNPAQAALRLGLLTGGLTLVWLLARSQVAGRFLERMIERALQRFTDLDTRDYVGLLRLADHWVVVELEVEEDDWLCNTPLKDLALPDEGILVLGIERNDGRWVGAPSAASTLHPYDTAVLYGTREAIDRLDQRSHNVEGELDRVASEVEFTEHYLEQQELEKVNRDGQHRQPRGRPRLKIGRRPRDPG
ncbi:MAG: TrkA C-terminal domain-containing protein [Acidimicrobiales bacterium]